MTPSYFLGRLQINFKRDDIMPTTNLNVRVDAELEKEAEETLTELGLNMPSAVNAFNLMIVREQRIPFELTLQHRYNEETLRAIEDVGNNRNLSGPFHGVKELMEDLDA